MTTADEAYEANAERELTDLMLRKDFELPGHRRHREEKAREAVIRMAIRQADKQPRWVVKTLLNDLFGENELHEDVASDLLLRFADAHGILIRALRWLVHYKEEGQL